MALSLGTRKEVGGNTAKTLCDVSGFRHGSRTRIHFTCLAAPLRKRIGSTGPVQAARARGSCRPPTCGSKKSPCRTRALLPAERASRVRVPCGAVLQQHRRDIASLSARLCKPDRRNCATSCFAGWNQDISPRGSAFPHLGIACGM